MRRRGVRDQVGEGRSLRGEAFSIPAKSQRPWGANSRAAMTYSPEVFSEYGCFPCKSMNIKVLIVLPQARVRTTVVPGTGLPMSLSFLASCILHKSWGGPPGGYALGPPTPRSACRRLHRPDSSREERVQGDLAQRAPRPGGPPHELCQYTPIGKNKRHWAEACGRLKACPTI